MTRARRRGESNGPGLLKVLAVAFGAGVVGAVVFDLHEHRCESCGRKWKHLGHFNHGDREAHTCPGCGKVEWNQDGYLSDNHEHVTLPDGAQPADSDTPHALPPGSRRT